jgi:cytochrome oxidase Cu insertion factor (SCO1/SenC/PrrC family)
VDDVKAFAAQFGIFQEADPSDPAQITHSLRTAVVDATGKLYSNRSGNDWTPAEILADLTKAPSASAK